LGRALTAGMIALGTIVSPAAAMAESRPTKELNATYSESPTLISQSFGDLFQNVFRYIQVSTISDQQEVEIGQDINQRLLNRQYRLSPNQQAQQYVNNIGQRLVQASDSRDIPFTFQVVASDQVNAFAVPGGFIYVTEGLIEEADNEAQLASVIAHEIAHINQRHGIKALKRQVLAGGIADIAGVDSSTLAQIGYQVAVELPRSRDFEYAADEGGLRILDRAGYPPSAFVNFLQQLMDASVPPEFLRTHPTTENRINAIQKQIQAMQ
jgi:predicted Zn-dependent protease